MALVRDPSPDMRRVVVVGKQGLQALAEKLSPSFLLK